MLNKKRDEKCYYTVARRINESKRTRRVYYLSAGFDSAGAAAAASVAGAAAGALVAAGAGAAGADDDDDDDDGDAASGNAAWYGAHGSNVSGSAAATTALPFASSINSCDRQTIRAGRRSACERIAINESNKNW
jgi:hypothetical protein